MVAEHDDREFWEDLADVVDGDAAAVERHADLLADSDTHRDARHEAQQVAEMVADAGADYEAPIDMKARVLSAVDANATEVTAASTEETRDTVPGDAPNANAMPGADGPTRRDLPRPDASKSPQVGKIIVLFGGLAAAAVGVLALGIGGYVFFSGGVQTALSGDGWTGRVTRIARASGDNQSGVSSGTSVDDLRPIALGATVASGDTVRTDGRTRVELELSDGSRLVLNHETQLTLVSGEARQVRLQAGEVVADVAHMDSGPQAEFDTPAGRVVVVGTKFILSATDDSTSVRVTRGVVRVQSGGGPGAEVKAGQEGVLARGQAPSVGVATQLARSLAWSELNAPGDMAEEPIRGLGELRAKRPGESRDRERPLTLASHKSTVRIVGNVARTEIEETFQNDSGQTLEGIYRFPLPPDARIASLSLEVDDRWEEGAFVERSRAQKIWRGVIRNATPRRQRQAQEEFIWVPGPWRDPALLEWQRGGRFELRIFPIPAHGARRVRLAYTQNIAPNGQHGRRYVHPLAHSGDESTRVGRFEVDVRVAGNEGPVRAHGYEMASTREDSTTVLRYAADNFLPSGDLVLDYELPNRESEVRWWTFQGEATVPPAERSREGSPEVVREQRRLHADTRGYVVFAVRPDLPAWTQSQRRDYVLMLDSSQSMVGDRFRRASEIALGMVREMDRRDRFMVLACDATCDAMSADFLVPSSQSAAQLQAWLGGIEPAGASDLGSNLRGAVAAAGSKRQNDRNVHVIYVGDGLSSVGHRRPASLSAEVSTLMEADPQLAFTTVGIGGDADRLALSAMARAGGGHYVPYVAGERASTAALAVLETTYGVSLRSASLEMPEGVADVAPAALPTIRAGEEVLVVGRLTGGTVRGELSLRGKVGGQEFVQRYPVSLEVSTSRGNAFVPRQWASATIEQLELSGAGEAQAKQIALSKAYGVLSPHTSLLVLESAAMFRAFGVDRARPTIQWTGDEQMEMGETTGLDRHATAGVAGSGNVGTLGRGGRAGGGQPSAEDADDILAGAPGRMATRARRRRRPPMDRPARAPAAEQEAAPVAAQTPPPPPRRPRGPGRWQRMRREWYRESTIHTSSVVRPRDLERVQRAETALRENSDSRDRHRALVQALSRAGQLERAREIAQKWMERDRLDPEALTYYSDVLGRMGQRDRALRVLSGIVDLEPENRVLQERMAKAFERGGMPERACAHRVSLAEMRGGDAAAQGAALRCERSLGRASAAQRLLQALPSDQDRQRAERQAQRLARPSRVRGDLMLDARWGGSADLDVSLVTPQGTRISWMGGRRSVVGEQGTARGNERVGLRRAAPGSYYIEVSRTNQESQVPVTGNITVRSVGGTRRVIPFTLTGNRVGVGRVDVMRRSRMVPVSGPGPAAPLGINQARGRLLVTAGAATRVQVDGRVVGNTPIAMPIAVGRHRLEATAPGGRRVRRTINVRPNQTVRVRF